ncbi:hypothetical protein CDL12_12177 [Handroanthus impetiginosus]|uniref:DNA-directed DNA polymerase n=1 Tax=Handroanthus impetiginosus TaxID=429701 RepID=A0A2G9HCC5_9LAMI|nr:hypothetical protein CDL12_12177 [Handroanthus impetiginosus]
MQRSQIQNLAPYDPEIEQTFRAQRRKREEHVEQEVKVEENQNIIMAGNYENTPVENLALPRAREQKSYVVFPELSAEIIYEAWNRFKKMLRNCLNHDILRHIQVHTFYHGLTDRDSFLSSTIAECHNLLNNLVANHYEKKSEQAAASKAAGIIEVDQVTAFNAKIDFLIQSKKNFGVNQVQHTPVTCDECGEGHPSDQCPHSVESIQFCQAVTLRNGRELQEVVKEPAKAKGKEVTSEENEKVVEAPLEKRCLGDYETVALTEECSAIQNKLPHKLKDLGSFTIPCTIGTHFSGRALCDLGANINLMPYSIYRTLGLGEAKPTDRSLTYPKEVIEDILVKVDKFIFPANFIVLNMEANSEILIILGRPFLATGRTLIDVQKGELTMRVQDQQITFNSFKAMKFPNESDECFSVSILDNLAGKEVIAERPLDILERALLDLADEEDEDDLEAVKALDASKFFKPNGVKSLIRTAPSKVLKPSIKEPPILELKPLPNHLSYAYLGESDTLPVIILFSLFDVQVEKLLRVLRDHKSAIGWTIADIKGIS